VNFELAQFDSGQTYQVHQLNHYLIPDRTLSISGGA